MCGPRASRRRAPSRIAKTPTAPIRKLGGEPTVEDAKRTKSVDELRLWAADRDPKVRAQVARNRATPEDALASLANDAEVDVVRAAVKHPATPGAALALLGSHTSNAVRKAVAGHANTPFEVVQSMLGDRMWEVREAAVGNAVLDRETLLAFLDSPWGLPHRHRFGADPTIDYDRHRRWLGEARLWALVDRAYAFNLARREHLPDDILLMLEPWSLNIVLAHPSCSAAVFRELVEQGSFEDCEAARYALAHPMATPGPLAQVVQWCMSEELDSLEWDSGLLAAVQRELGATRKFGHLALAPEIDAPVAFTERARRQLIRLSRQVVPPASSLRIEAATEEYPTWHGTLVQLVGGRRQTAIPTFPREYFRIVGAPAENEERAAVPSTAVRVEVSPEILGAVEGKVIDYVVANGVFVLGLEQEHAVRVDVPENVVVVE